MCALSKGLSEARTMRDEREESFRTQTNASSLYGAAASYIVNKN